MKRNNKSLATLGIVLVVLGGAAFLLANPFAKPKTDINGAVPGSGPSGGAKVLIDTKKDAVTAISILAPKQTEFRLQKDGDKWKAVQGDKKFNADQDKLDKILEALPGLTSEALASTNADKYKDYGLDADTAVTVGVFTTAADKPAVTLLVGNSGPGSTSTFVRVNDGKEVWRASTNVKALVGFSFKDYRSKKPWPFDPQVVKSLTVRPVDGKPDTYTFDNGTWKTAGGTNANQNAIVKLLEDWSKANVNDFADDVTPGVTKMTPAAPPTPPATPDGKTPPAAPPAPGEVVDIGTEPNLSVETPQGAFSFTIGQKDGTLYYVADQDKLVYKIAEPNVAFFRNLKFDDLKIAPPPVDQATKMTSPAPNGAAPGIGSAPVPGSPAPKPGAPSAPGTPPSTPPLAPPAKPGTPPAAPPAKPGAPPVAPPTAPPAKPGGK